MNYSWKSSVALLAATLVTPVTFAEDEASTWGLGVGGIASSDPYAGRETRYVPLPIITYDSKRFFFRGIEGGMHLYDDDWLKIDALIKGDFSGIDAKDFGRQELANNGINRDLLTDRDDTAQAGFKISLEGQYGEFAVEAGVDVLDASGGFEVKAEYGYPINFGSRLTLTPTVGVNWLSADTANYYYGTLDEEVARGVVRYRPGAAAIPEVGVELKYNFSGKWLLMSNISYQSLPSKLSDSPLLDSDKTARAFIGVLRVF